jgi:hypothetical protein
VADFDPFANQGGPAAWDPEHSDDSRQKADELLRKAGGASGAEPGDFGTGTEDARAEEAAETAEKGAGPGGDEPAREVE